MSYSALLASIGWNVRIAMFTALVIFYSLNPLIISGFVYFAVFWAMSRVRRDTHYRLRWVYILAAMIVVVAAAVDITFAYQRVRFGNGLDDHSQVFSTVPIPDQVVLVNLFCLQSCFDRITAGAHGDVTVLRTQNDEEAWRGPTASHDPPVRYRAIKAGETCGTDSDQVIGSDPMVRRASAVISHGICPEILSSEPKVGTFVVHQFLRRRDGETSIAFGSSDDRCEAAWKNHLFRYDRSAASL